MAMHTYYSVSQAWGKIKKRYTNGKTQKFKRRFEIIHKTTLLKMEN
jgi:ribosomal protein L31